MFQFIPVNQENIFAIKVSGRLTDADYEQFIPEMERILAEHAPVSLFVELDDFHGWEPKALWDDFKFGMQHDKDFERIAVVGQNNWHSWMARLGNAFTEGKVRFFQADQMREAWDWLRSKDQDDSQPLNDGQFRIPGVYQHILLATDFSPCSVMVLQRTLDLVEHYHAQWSLIHVIEHIGYPGLGYDPLLVDAGEFIELDEQRFEQAREQLNALVEGVHSKPSRIEVIWGTPKNAILSYAQTQDVDLIIVGSHGHKGLARLLGSTTSAIIHAAHQDVLRVRCAESF